MSKYVIAAALVWTMAFACGMGVGGYVQPLSQGETSPDSLTSGQAAVVILKHNLVLSCILLAGASAFGALTVLTLAWMGLLFGLQVGWAMATLGMAETVAAILPHGLTEMGGFIVLGSVGMRVGASLFGVVFLGRDFGLERNVQTAGLLGFSAVLASAAVEVYVTPMIMGGL